MEPLGSFTTSQASNTSAYAVAMPRTKSVHTLMSSGMTLRAQSPWVSRAANQGSRRNIFPKPKSRTAIKRNPVSW